MALSDEILESPATLASLKARIARLIGPLQARAGFLVDEVGQPFASVGHVEFVLNMPWASFTNDDSADSVLAAMIGEKLPEDAGCAVERAGDRALLVLLLSRSAKLTDVERKEMVRTAGLLADDVRCD